MLVKLDCVTMNELLMYFSVDITNLCKRLFIKIMPINGNGDFPGKGSWTTSPPLLACIKVGLVSLG